MNLHKDKEVFEKQLEQLKKVGESEATYVKEVVKEIVPTYQMSQQE